MVLVYLSTSHSFSGNCPLCVYDCTGFKEAISLKGLTITKLSCIGETNRPPQKKNRPEKNANGVST